MDPQSILWLVFAIIWLVFSGIGNKRKKEAEQRRKSTQAGEKPRPKQTSMEEVLRELKRRAETVEKPVVISQKPAEVRTLKPAKKQISNQQEIVRGKEIFSIEEKRKALEYEAFVRKQRRTEHDAENRHLEEKIQEFYTDDENEAKVEIDLKNLIIADAILNRPYADL